MTEYEELKSKGWIALKEDLPIVGRIVVVRCDYRENPYDALWRRSSSRPIVVHRTGFFHISKKKNSLCFTRQIL